MNTRVLVASDLAGSGRQYLLDRYYELIVAPEDAGDQTDAARMCDAVLLHHGAWPRERLERVGSRLKAICTPGVGLQGIDLPAASALGIWVVDIAPAGVLSRAEYEIALLLSCCKQIVRMDYLAHSGNAAAFRPSDSVELHGKQLGFIGWDETAAMVAHQCRLAFEMSSCCLTESPAQMLPAAVGRCGSLAELLCQADIVCVHAAVHPGMLDLDAFRHMKPSAYLICMTACGSIVCPDLCDALQQGVLAGAAVGQVIRWQAGGEQLLQQPGVMSILPQACYTYEALSRMDLFAAQALDAILSGRRIAELRTQPVCPRIRLHS